MLLEVCALCNMCGNIHIIIYYHTRCYVRYGFQVLLYFLFIHVSDLFWFDWSRFGELRIRKFDDEN